MGYGAGPHSESGTRLKVTWYAGSDGSKIIRADAFDSELGFYCYMAKNADGVTRCFPSVLAGYPYYMDDACTVPAVGFFACMVGDVSHVTAQILGADALACPRVTYKAYRLASVRRDFAYNKTSAGCVRTSSPNMEYAEAVEVPDGSLVVVTDAVDSP